MLAEAPPVVAVNATTSQGHFSTRFDCWQSYSACDRLAGPGYANRDLYIAENTRSLFDGNTHGVPPRTGPSEATAIIDKHDSANNTVDVSAYASGGTSDVRCSNFQQRTYRLDNRQSIIVGGTRNWPGHAGRL